MAHPCVCVSPHHSPTRVQAAMVDLGVTEVLGLIGVASFFMTWSARRHKVNRRAWRACLTTSPKRGGMLMTFRFHLNPLICRPYNSGMSTHLSKRPQTHRRIDRLIGKSLLDRIAVFYRAITT
jgi:hypothetical protein